jgi:hypothetical protein
VVAVTVPFITESGIYEMTEVEYHADPVVGGSLSSTGARTLATRTPAHFDYERHHGRPDRPELDFGRVAHARVLGRGTDVAVVVGTGKDRNAWRTDADKAAVAKARAAGKTPIKMRENQAINDMADALRAHPTAGPLLARPGRHESVWVWQDPTTGVWCRVMADFIPDVPDGARRIVVDYKTSGDASPVAFAKSMANYGYDQQADWYTAGVQALDPRDEHPQFVLIAQEKTPPYLVTVAYPDEQALARGHLRNRRALELYRHCTETNTWPGYATDPVELQLPVWAAREFEAEQNAYDALDQFGDTAA